jgi:hypothetical protein
MYTRSQPPFASRTRSQFEEQAIKQRGRHDLALGISSFTATQLQRLARRMRSSERSHHGICSVVPGQPATNDVALVRLQ